MDHYISTIDENAVHASDGNDTSFTIPVGTIQEHLPQWVDVLSLTTDFITEGET